MQARGVFFDGEVAADREVSIELGQDHLKFWGGGVSPQSWAYASMTAIDPPHEGHPFRMAHSAKPGARLVIGDAAFVTELLTRGPHLRSGFNPPRALRGAAWTLAGLAAVALVLYLILQLVPQRIAFLLPDSWGERVGAQIEASLTAGAKECRSATGVAALSAMIARLADGDPELPPLAIRVYDIPVMNAFALPGGRVVVTRALIEKAQAPEEVAGVLAHEAGHVSYRHSEAQLVRATGLQIVVSLATGGGGDTITSFAGLAAILRYSRAAEREADDYAIAMLRGAVIDPLGFKRFFERVRDEENKSATGVFGRFGSVLATHPGTDDRIARIEPLPKGVTPRPVMTQAQWQALKAICK